MRTKPPEGYILALPDRCLRIRPLNNTQNGHVVNHYNSSTWINIRRLLHKANQLVEKGEKWRLGAKIVGN
jgi:hypothetical protein